MKTPVPSVPKSGISKPKCLTGSDLPVPSVPASVSSFRSIEYGWNRSTCLNGRMIKHRGPLWPTSLKIRLRWFLSPALAAQPNLPSGRVHLQHRLDTGPQCYRRPCEQRFPVSRCSGSLIQTHLSPTPQCAFIPLDRVASCRVEKLKHQVL